MYIINTILSNMDEACQCACMMEGLSHTLTTYERKKTTEFHRKAQPQTSSNELNISIQNSNNTHPFEHINIIYN